MSQLPSGERWGTPWTSPRHIAGLRQQPYHMAFSGWYPAYLNGTAVVESPTNKTNEIKDTSSLTGSVPRPTVRKEELDKEQQGSWTKETT